MPKVNVAVRSEVKIVSKQLLKTTDANFTKLHREIEDNKKSCRLQVLKPKVKVTIMSAVKLCLKVCCSLTTESNLMKLHRKIKQNEKVCHAHD